MKNEEKESVPMKNLTVGLYGHTDDNQLEGRIDDIELFLTKNGGSCSVERTVVFGKGSDTNILIEFHATVPLWFANRHHGFDSVLNSTTKGFGVAWVTDK